MRQWQETVVAHRGALAALFGGILAPLLVFGTLAEDVWAHEGFAWDVPLMHVVHGYATPARDALMITISEVGGVYGLVPLCTLVTVVLLLRRRRRDAFFIALAYGGAEGLGGLAKLLFRSARPHLWVWPVHETGYGFPSGHAIGSMALLSALVLLLWPTRWRWLTLLVAVVCIGAVGFSRVYLGVHFPSDILAAWTAALAWVVGLHLILNTQPARRVPWRPARLQKVVRPPLKG